MRGTGFVALLACGMAVATCGSGGGTSSCVYSLTAMAGDRSFGAADVCREWSGASDQVAMREAECASGATTTDGGSYALETMFASGPCPRADIVGGGCRSTTNGVTHTDWYYSAGAPTVTDVVNICADEGAMFIPPP